jgi:triacylglycerol lipase
MGSGALRRIGALILTMVMPMTQPKVAAPIVLVHGILGFNQLALIGPYFRGIREALGAAGNTVPEPPQLNTAGSIEERARGLRDYLTDPGNSELFERPFHLIAHSMGGLDARYLISQNQGNIADRVLSLTTLGTPHQGTPLADLGTETFQEFLTTLIDLNVDVQGFFDLTMTKAVAFNEANKPNPKVKYYSVAGLFDPAHGLLEVPHQLIVEAGGGPSDGLVPVSSAEYHPFSPDNGSFLGTWPVNHFRLVNQGTNLLPTLVELADTSIVERYLGIVERLHDDGF